MKKGLILAALQVALALSVTAKFAYDRSTLPRVWVKAAPYDPSLPLRGRYVRLLLQGETEPLKQPVAFFIPQNVPDPSRRAAGEELWVEVSVPKQGAPRPIQLAVKKDGVLTPLAFR
ncbi:MAG: GDYXXLXY domain-containing protein [Bryobacteraceae bacterium]